MKHLKNSVLVYSIVCLSMTVGLNCLHQFNFKREITVDSDKACDPNFRPLVVAQELAIGRITSPSYTSEAYYPPNISCAWQINAPKQKIIHVFIDAREFGLDNKKRAVLQFFTSPELDKPPVKEYHGSLKVSEHFLTSANYLRIEFHGADKPRAKGFELYFDHQEIIANCSGKDPKSSSVSTTLPIVPMKAKTIVDRGESLFCRNQRRCFEPLDRCNGVDDCGDGSDEQDCEYLKYSNLSANYGFDLENWVRKSILNSSNCGRPSIEPLVRFGGKILGGERVVMGSWPWMVSIRFKKTQPVGHLCGAAIVNRYWLVTAGHCFFPIMNFSKYEIHLGRFNSIIPMGHEVVRYIEQVIVHPEFSPYKEENDIALIRMNAPIFEDSPFIQSICLSSVSPFLPSRSAYIIGWGSNNPNNEELFLKQAGIMIFSPEACQKIYQKSKKISEKIICAGRVEGGTDSCDGDSGGPLMMYDGRSERWILTGIVSSGSRICGEPNRPGTYTNVTYYKNWIDSVMVSEEMNRWWKDSHRAWLNRKADNFDLIS